MSAELAFTDAALTCLRNIYPERLDYLDQVFSYANEKTQQFASSADLHSQASQSNMLNLLLAPIKTYVSLFTALALPHFIPLLRSQTYPTRRALAGEIARSLLRNQTMISSQENLEAALEILKVLIKEGHQHSGFAGGPMRRGQENEETIEEQGWLARIVHLVQSPNNEMQLKVRNRRLKVFSHQGHSLSYLQLLQTTRRAYSEGNERIKYTTPALANSSFALARRLHSLSKKPPSDSAESAKSLSQSVYKFIHSLVSTLYGQATSSSSALSASSSSPVADLSLRLFLAAGQIADQTGFEEVSYEFFAQAFTVYEESVSDSRAQYQAVCCISGTLHGTRSFSRENYDTLITKCALHGSKLLKKPDQCRAVCAASHLWWGTEVRGRNDGEAAEDPDKLYRDGKRVLECLQRALRVADACMDVAVSVELFVEILNRYVYYFDQENEAVSPFRPWSIKASQLGLSRSVTADHASATVSRANINARAKLTRATPQVTTKYINGLIELIHSNLNTNETAPDALDNPKKHFERTLEYISGRDYEGVVTQSKT